MMSANKKSIRENFRNSVFERDKHKCRICGRHAADVHMDSHHITDRSEMPNGGYVKENGISLCDAPQADGAPSCHSRAEQFHISEGKTWEPGLHPDDLYKMIGSSKEKAIRASERLA
jgi:5-methylcytosine-specific restriction endonuclease McrA